MQSVYHRTPRCKVHIDKIKEMQNANNPIICSSIYRFLDHLNQLKAPMNMDIFVKKALALYDNENKLCLHTTLPTLFLCYPLAST